MLEEYVETQKIPTRVFVNGINTKKISHAYLIETNGYFDSNNYIMALIKYILCPSNKIAKKDCNGCKICNCIDDNSYCDIKNIYPINNCIRKEQVNELQREFSTKKIYGSKRIYVIHNVELMNESSSNSLLKFLEEPSDDVVAFLVTSDSSKLLETVLSRCQRIVLKNELTKEELSLTLEEIILNSFYNKEEVNTYLDLQKTNTIILLASDFIKELEKTNSNLIVLASKLQAQIINKEEMLLFLNSLLLIYNEILNYILLKKKHRVIELINLSDSFLDSMSIENLVKKIGILIEIKKELKGNQNIALLFDKFTIMMEDKL